MNANYGLHNGLQTSSITPANDPPTLKKWRALACSATVVRPSVRHCVHHYFWCIIALFQSSLFIIFISLTQHALWACGTCLLLALLPLAHVSTCGFASLSADLFACLFSHLFLHLSSGSESGGPQCHLVIIGQGCHIIPAITLTSSYKSSGPVDRHGTQPLHSPSGH